MEDVGSRRRLAARFEKRRVPGLFVPGASR